MKLITLLVVITAIDMACGDELLDIFPSFNYPNMNNLTIEKTLIFLDFSYLIRSNSTASIILVRAALRTEIGVRYFEGNFEIRTRSNWEYLSWGGDLGDSLTRFDNEFSMMSFALSVILPSPYIEIFTGFEFVRSVMTNKTVSSKRGRYIRSELKRQEIYDSDMACILNWYCTFQKKKISGRVKNVNYIEHDRVKEFKE